MKTGVQHLTVIFPSKNPCEYHVYAPNANELSNGIRYDKKEDKCWGWCPR